MLAIGGFLELLSVFVSLAILWIDMRMRFPPDKGGAQSSVIVFAARGHRRT
ncbi:hypothetical protein [Breoghania sp.]|uniref:hypothetical protein n=1 Tax=Breoghania sp. TaxID=2065378 RepID=UPI002AA8B23F|nr:hypothetical protein [Breoghania sp.]